MNTLNIITANPPEYCICYNENTPENPFKIDKNRKVNSISTKYNQNQYNNQNLVSQSA